MCFSDAERSHESNEPVKKTSFNKLEDSQELHMGSPLHQNVSLKLADRFHNTRSERGQPSFAHHVFLRKKVEKTVRSIRNVMICGANGHIFRSDVMLLH